MQKRNDFFPPLASKGQRPWRLKFRGYQHEDILTQTIKTDTEGMAQFNSPPSAKATIGLPGESSQGVDAEARSFLPPIKAEAYVFVATNATTDLGYRNAGVEIVVDKDTFRAGQTAPVMISVSMPDRYVLFSVEADDLFSYQRRPRTGNVKLIELPIEEKHVPNVFLSAAMVSDGSAFLQTKQVVVPPVEQIFGGRGEV